MLIAIVNCEGLDQNEREKLKEILRKYGFMRSYMRIQGTGRQRSESFMRLPEGVFVDTTGIYSMDTFEKIKEELFENDLLVPIVFLNADVVGGYMYVWHEREL